MKSRRCAECNVSSVRSIAGLPEVDACPVSAAESAGLLDPGWLCASCSAPWDEVEPALTKAVTRDPAPRTRSESTHLRVLLVDDEEMVRRCTARCLAGFEIVIASSGAEALAILSRDADFDVVLSDVMMPQMTGPELFEHCCERHPELAQRFVFASGDPESARLPLLRAVERVGAEHVPTLLGKPSSREALQRAVVAAAAHHVPRSGTWLIAEALPEVKKYRG